ncbi:MAG: hypothetical protein WHT06_00450 [Desulfobacterales bacterium]
MIGPDRLERVTAGAVVPEQVVAYVQAVTGAAPALFGSCVGYRGGEGVVLVGYPLEDPRDEGGMSRAVEQALSSPGVARITVLGPARPRQAPPSAQSRGDAYLALPLPAPPRGAKLRNLLRRAARELYREEGGSFGREHEELVGRYLREREFAAGTRLIFERIPQVLAACAEARLFSVRLPDGRLVAFAVGEFSALTTAFFLFCFRDPDLAPPGSADFALAGLVAEAERRGHARVNLGLAVNEGVSFFKRKWGALPFLPCVETSWVPGPQRSGLARLLRERLGGRR